ncbi:hypothetical protein [Nucisporomicrobium flavum]|uniref:hypothetical protein n=1 Tax=Nucisporomicrobium flavum TaxID=2785915 RepID=UPI0018F3FDF1|nr:hypothetical protein [Nucisporomicrobium flavum]
MDPMVLLVAGYAGLMVAVAAGLEWLARHAAVRSDRYRTAGFTYQPDHDLWVCPRDETLWPHEVDRERRVVRYRARPTVCNACPAKPDCTSSHTGREIVRPIDRWPHSEAGRFHRGVSVTLAAVAAAFVGAALAAFHRPVELAVLVPAGALTGWLLWRWARDFWRTPSGFPDVSTVRHRGTEDPAAENPGRSAGPVLVDLVPPSRRRTGTAWGFDRQPTARGYRSTREAGTDDGEEDPT